jgi:hypothetical protein
VGWGPGGLCPRPRQDFGPRRPARRRPLARGRGGAHAVSMSKTRTEVMAESRKKGLAAGAATAATVALGVAVSWPVAVVAAVPTAVLGWRWWKHRAENGIKF